MFPPTPRRLYLLTGDTQVFSAFLKFADDFSCLSLKFPSISTFFEERFCTADLTAFFFFSHYERDFFAPSGIFAHSSRINMALFFLFVFLSGNGVRPVLLFFSSDFSPAFLPVLRARVLFGALLAKPPFFSR